MPLWWTSAQQSLRAVCREAAEVFVTGSRGGPRQTLLLLLTCASCGLLLASLLLLYLLFALDYGPAAAGGVSGCCGALLTAALALSRRARCSWTLFVISAFMKKSRNLLLAAGTSVVVLGNVRNSLENLAGLARSVVCNLSAKRAAVVAPFRSYVEMLRWVGHVLKGVTDLGDLKLSPELKVSPRLDSERLWQELREAERRLNDTVTYARALTDAVSSVTERALPAVSLLALAAFTAVHVLKFRNDVKYKNRFVSGRFVRFDEQQRADGKPAVLPLGPEERGRYATLPSARPTAAEGRAALRFGVPVVSHCAVWALFVTADALLYCLIRILTVKLSQLEPLHVPLLMSIKGFTAVLGLPLSEESHQRDFSYSVNLFEKKCLPQPKLLLQNSLVPLVAILVVLLLMALLAAKMTQLRILVCERFFPAAADARVEYLHAKILRKRLKKRMSRPAPFYFQPRFWCPLLFRPKEDPPTVV